MQIKGDAETSARTGIPSYSVFEDDRSVCWTLDARTLEEMRPWDALSREERMEKLLKLRAWRAGRNGDSSDGDVLAVLVNPVDKIVLQHDGSDWLDLHAIVARNVLRSYLGDKRGAPVASS